jgi:hypothetical protein
MTSHADKNNTRVDGHSYNRVNAQPPIQQTIPRNLKNKTYESSSKTY